LAPDVLDAIEELVADQVDERLRAATIKRRLPDYLTPAEAAKVLRCDRQRVYDLVSSGRLAKRKDGTRTLIPRADLEAYLANGRR